MLGLCGVQRINGGIVEHDMVPQGTKLEYRTDDDGLMKRQVGSGWVLPASGPLWNHPAEGQILLV